MSTVPVGASASQRITDHLTAILATVTTAREAITVDAADLVDRILGGDADALAEGETIHDTFEALADGLNAMARTAAEGTEIDSLALSMVFGVLELFDATAVAKGWEISGDPAVDARFLPVRLAHQRRVRERWLEQLDPASSDADEVRCELALIAAGVEAE